MFNAIHIRVYDVELHRNRDPRIPPVERYCAYSYARTVHPCNCRNYINGASEGGAAGTRNLDDKDNLVLDLLYKANMEVCAHRAHSAGRVLPSLPGAANPRSGMRYAITNIMLPEHHPLAMKRLAEYLDAYTEFEMTDTTATCTDVFPAPPSSVSLSRAAGEGPQLTLTAES